MPSLGAAVAVSLGVFAIGLSAASCGANSANSAPAAPLPPPPASSEFIVPPPNFVGLWTFCDHGNRVYETADPAGDSNTSQVTVAPADPTCRVGP